MRSFVIWCMLLATMVSADDQIPEEESRQFPYDLLPTQPPPAWLTPPPRRSSLIQNFRKSFLNWLPSWLSATEPPVLYPRPSYYQPGYYPAYQAVPASGWPASHYVVPQYLPSRPYHSAQGYGQRPQLAAPPRPSSNLYGLAEVPNWFPYAGESAPRPVYETSGLGAQSAPQPVYEAPPAQAKPTGNAPQKASGNSQASGNAALRPVNGEAQPVYKAPTAPVHNSPKSVGAPTSSDNKQTYAEPTSHYKIKEHKEVKPTKMVEPDSPVKHMEPQPSGFPIEVPTKLNNEMKFVPSPPGPPHPFNEAIRNVPAPDLTKEKHILNNRPRSQP